ncbi:MAG: hypothetical protein LBH29_07070 [Elusimicrobiota bacterium]|jgi:glutamate synthase domain-containing protein 3|nr:hypothetical protein [Elusimicrobiota bacterium]
MKKIDAAGIYYRDLNAMLDGIVADDKEIVLENVFGQRYIGRGLQKEIKISINGVPGNDMAAYMDGAEIEVFGNAQDGAGNTMNDGLIKIHGSCGDTAGYAMRGGSIYIEKSAGYRVGIHMKEYQHLKPVIVIGSKAGDFLGEYMAGGNIILLGLDLEKGADIVGKYCGTGMHGGSIYINGVPSAHKMGKEAVKSDLNDYDLSLLENHINFYGAIFNRDMSSIKPENFSKYAALNKNPYKNMYCKL